MPVLYLRLFARLKARYSWLLQFSSLSVEAVSSGNGAEWPRHSSGDVPSSRTAAQARRRVLLLPHRTHRQPPHAAAMDDMRPAHRGGRCRRGVGIAGSSGLMLPPPRLQAGPPRERSCRPARRMNRGGPQLLPPRAAGQEEGAAPRPRPPPRASWSAPRGGARGGQAGGGRVAARWGKEEGETVSRSACGAPCSAFPAGDESAASSTAAHGHD